MTRVVLQEGESFDDLLRRFRKKVTHAGILSSVRKKRYFVAGSEKRRKALQKAKRRERKRQWRENRGFQRA
jgi:small subunit ribosomal protein S21